MGGRQVSVAPEISTAGRLISLCREYSESLSKISSDAIALTKLYGETAANHSGFFTSAKPYKNFVRHQLNALQNNLTHLQVGIRELIRAVSQQIEHAGLEFDDRLELQIRLADLEGKLKQTEELTSIALPE
jgi:hypothetical protein